MKIAAVTIANNASDIIETALKSVADHVDLIVLVDTGIDDDTIDKAKAVAEGASKQIRVCRHAWKNDFSAARNASLDFARKYEADWAIVVDTDERFVWGDCDKSALTEYLSKTKSDVVQIEAIDRSYVKEKIIRLSSDTRYVGPVHEAPIRSGPASTLANVLFDEREKQPPELMKKRLRDVSALTDWLSDKDNAKDGRWWYYLGDTHFALGDMAKAAECFGKCANLRKPFSEEGAYAAYRQADCLMQMGRNVEALEACAFGLSRYAAVAELAWKAALACYVLGRRDQACVWAYMSISMGRFKGCSPAREMFVHLPALYELPFDVLRFALPEESQRKHAEADFHTAKRARLGASNDLELDQISISKGPNRFDARAMLRPSSLRSMLDTTRVIELRPSRKTLEEACVPHYHACNPSVVARDGDLWAVVRMVNYTIENGQYVPCDADGKVRTVNLFGRLVPDGSFYTLPEASRMQDLDQSPRSDANVLGYEDVRPLIDNAGRLWASATVQDHGPGCHIALLELGDGFSIVQAKVQKTDRQVEKNWMPIVGKGLTWLYEIEPTQTFPRDAVSRENKSTLALDHLRGGSHVVPFDDGYLCVTHETIHMDGWGCRRIYLHRFVKFDKDLKIEAVSPAWTFEDDHYGIEFCCGMAIDPRDPNRLVLSYGVEDKEAKLLVVLASEIRTMSWIKAEQSRS